MGITTVIFAGIFIALANLCMRRSIDAGGNAKAYLVVQLSLSFLVAILLNPVRAGDYSWDPTTAALGLFGGLFLLGLMWSIGKSLENGTPGLTFATINSAAVMPAIVMAGLFGITFGHGYTVWHAVGSVLVVGGLFWAGREKVKAGAKSSWLTFLGLAALFNIAFLVFMQWRVLLMKDGLPISALLPIKLSSVGAQWFMPMILLSAAGLQVAFYLIKERKKPKGMEVFYGILGGIANGAGTFFLIRATEVSQAWENAMLFPVYSIMIIIACNIWGTVLYQEKINWRANALCMTGLVVGTVNWQVIQQHCCG